MGPNDREWNGGKFPNRGDEGLALEEFANEPSPNNRRSTPPPAPRVADFEEHRRARLSRESMPPIGIAGAVAIAALALGSGLLFFFSRARRPKAREDAGF